MSGSKIAIGGGPRVAALGGGTGLSTMLRGREICVADVAAGFQQAVLDVVVAKTVDAAIKMKKDKIVMAGGVSANSRLREMMTEECEKHGLKLYYPSPILCTDNAAMIGCAAYYQYLAGQVSDLTLDAIPNLPL